MTISITEAALPRLMSGKAVVLVERSLSHLLPIAVGGQWDTLEFGGTTIGATGNRVTLDETRLPLAVILIIERVGSEFGKELLHMLAEAGHPVLPRLFSVKWWQAYSAQTKSDVVATLRAALEAAQSSSIYSPLEMNRQITQLRQQLERERAQNDRLGVILAELGLFGDELVIDNLVAADLRSVSLPIVQDAPISLRHLKRIAVYDLGDVPSRIEFEISIGGKTAYTAVLDTLGTPGWLHIPLPETLMLSAADAAFHLRALTGDLAFAGREGKLTCRLYWNETSAIDGEKPQLAPAPLALGSIRVPRESGPLLSGIWLDAETTVHAQTDDVGGIVQGRIDLVPHGGDTVTASNPAFPDAAQSNLSLATNPSPAAGRYDVVLKLDETGLVEREVTWRSWATSSTAAQKPLSFAVARFATLRGAMSYCDGPRRELELNTNLGFPILSSSDGQPYMQTHPVEEQIVGAVFPQIVPVGTKRLWTDIENAHPQADSIEFILAIRAQLIKGPVRDWVTSLPTPPTTALSIIDLPGGELVARVTMAPGTARTLDIQLPFPLPLQGQLYCLVNGINASSRYGWCRWNSIAFAIDESTPLPVSP